MHLETRELEELGEEKSSAQNGTIKAQRGGGGGIGWKEKEKYGTYFEIK